ncbi:MAG: hypothetical protein GX811_00215, partial [Lentisphaerae bacterium]|nr:hypothetical protein [Lentisphaerota bacterium]
MKLSVMSYTLARSGWFKDEKLGYLKKTIDLAKEIGTDGIDWVTTHGLEPKEIRKAMDDNGIKASCYTLAVPGLSSPSFVERAKSVDMVKT